MSQAQNSIVFVFFFIFNWKCKWLKLWTQPLAAVLVAHVGSLFWFRTKVCDFPGMWIPARAMAENKQTKTKQKQKTKPKQKQKQNKTKTKQNKNKKKQKKNTCFSFFFFCSHTFFFLKYYFFYYYYYYIRVFAICMQTPKHQWKKKEKNDFSLKKGKETLNPLHFRDPKV